MSSYQSGSSGERVSAKRAKTAQEAEQSDDDEYMENNKQPESQNISVVEKASVEWQLIPKDDAPSFVLTRMCNIENELGIITLRGKRGYVELIRNGEMTHLHCTKESSGALFVKGVVSESGTTVAALTDNFVVYVWDIVNWTFPKILFAVHTSAKVENRGQRRSSFIGLSQSGKYLIVHEIDSPIFVWSSCHMETGDGTITTSAKIVATLQGPNRGTAAECTAMAFDEEERFLTLGFVLVQGNSSRQFESCFYDFHTIHAYGSGNIMQPRGCLRGQDNRICSIAFGNDGSQVLTCSEDAKAMVWRLDTFRCAMFLLHPNGLAVSNGLVISDGAHIVTSASDGLIRIWGCYPKYPRDGRGSVSLLCKLEPPKEVRREGSKILHFALTRDGQSLVVVWRCMLNSTESQSNGQSDSNHADAVLDGASSLSKSLMGENRPTTLAEVLNGAAAASKRKSEGLNGQETHDSKEISLAIVRYDAIPLLVRAYRANVALALSQLANKHGLGPTHELRFKSRVMKFLSNVSTTS